MLPFQKTSIYQKFLNISYRVFKVFIQNSGAIQKKTEETIIELMSDIATGLIQQSMDKKIPGIKQNIMQLLTILDIAKMTEKQIKNKNEISQIQNMLTSFSSEIEDFPKRQKCILILSAIYGSAHLSASNSIKQALEELYGYDFRIEIVDFLEILNATFNKSSHYFYEGSIRHMPSLWQFLFTSTDKKWQVKLLNMLHYPFAANKLTKFFQEKNPSLIISTFPVWDYIAIQIWKKHNPEAKFISVVTDSISIHSSWATADSDYHIVANKETALSLQKLGVKTDKIKILGFPVNLRFLEKIDRKKCLSAIGLDPKLYTIIFLPTHETIGKTSKTMKELLKGTRDYNLIVIAGRNTKLIPKLKKYANHKNVHTIGWTDELPNLINSADLVITKAGGATVMECIASKKPMLINHIIPGHETGNAEFIKKYDLGLILDENSTSIRKSIEYIRKHQKEYLKRFEEVAKPKAALDIAKFIRGCL